MSSLINHCWRRDRNPNLSHQFLYNRRPPFYSSPSLAPPPLSKAFSTLSTCFPGILKAHCLEIFTAECPHQTKQRQMKTKNLQINAGLLRGWQRPTCLSYYLLPLKDAHEQVAGSEAQQALKSQVKTPRWKAGVLSNDVTAVPNMAQCFRLLNWVTSTWNIYSSLIH